MVPGVPPTIGYDRTSSQTFDDSHLGWVIKSIVFTPLGCRQPKRLQTIDLDSVPQRRYADHL